MVERGSVWPRRDMFFGKKERCGIYRSSKRANSGPTGGSLAPTPVGVFFLYAFAGIAVIFRSSQGKKPMERWGSCDTGHTSGPCMCHAPKGVSGIKQIMSF